MSELSRIEFGELRVGDVARRHIGECLDSNWISMGPKVKLLEERFAELMGTKYAVAVSSGTAALTAMTLALPEIAKRPVKRGVSNVLCPALGFIANTTGIISGGLIPKWVDTKYYDLNINEDLVEAAIDDDTVAIYCIGTMGQAANMPQLKEIADKYDLVLFEDACENYGSTINGIPSHKWAIAGCSSMYTAHLTVAGEGSLIYTDDEHLRDLITSIRSHGRKPNDPYFEHMRLGSNFKMTDLCASVGIEGCEQFHDNIAARKKIWQELVDFVNENGFTKDAWFSSEPEGTVTMPHGFSITVKPWSNLHISNLKSLFDDYNIHWKLNFGAVGSHNAVAEFRDERDFLAATWCGENGIHIGCHRYLNEENVERIKGCLGKFFN